jgi:hypothetical protein
VTLLKLHFSKQEGWGSSFVVSRVDGIFTRKAKLFLDIKCFAEEKKYLKPGPLVPSSPCLPQAGSFVTISEKTCSINLLSRR